MEARNYDLRDGRRLGLDLACSFGRMTLFRPHILDKQQLLALNSRRQTSCGA